MIPILAVSLATLFSTIISEKKPTDITKVIRTAIVSNLGSENSLELKKSITTKFHLR